MSVPVQVGQIESVKRVFTQTDFNFCCAERGRQPDPREPRILRSNQVWPNSGARHVPPQRGLQRAGHSIARPRHDATGAGADVPQPHLLGAVYVALELFVPYGIVGTWKLRSFRIKQGRQRLLKLLTGRGGEA